MVTVRRFLSNTTPGDRLAGGLLALMALLAILFPARVLECDAVIYASAGIHRDVVQSTDAGHLAWGGVEVLAASIGRSMSPPLNPLYLLAWLSVFSMLTSAWLVHRLLANRLGVHNVLSALVAGTLLFSYSNWHFGLQGEPHAPHALALVMFLGAAWSWLTTPSVRAAVLTSAALAAATLLHQTTILLVPPVLLALLVARAGESKLRKARLHQAVWFLATYGVIVVGTYLVVGWFVRDLRTVADYRAWILGLSEWGGWGNWRATSPVAALVGIARSLLGSHYLLGIAPIGDVAGRLFPSASWEDERMLSGAVAHWLRPALALLEAMIFCGVAWIMARVARNLRVAWCHAWPFAVLLMGWLAVHFVFFMWWAPERAEFWIAFWLPFLVLLAPGLARSRVRPAALAAGLAGLVLVNLGGSIAPQASPALEPATLVAVAVDASVRAGDAILTDLPLNQRAGRFIYTLDVVDLPHAATRASVVADSLSRCTAVRGSSLWWVGYGDVPLPVFAAGLHAAPPTPVRAPVRMQRLH